MDFDTFDTDLFQELNDMPGEIFDIEEEKFDLQEYINGNTDYWCLSYPPSITQTQWQIILLNANNLCTTLSVLLMPSFMKNTMVMLQKEMN